MELTGTQYKELQKALLSAFPARDKLKQMVMFQLDQELDDFIGYKDMSAVIFDLIKWTKSQGKLKNLIIGASQENPDNPALKAFYQKYRDKLNLDNQLDSNQLFTILLRLNYTKQENLFKEFIENHQVGACLIHGEPEFGQRWLLNRLLRLVPNGINEYIVHRFTFSSAISSNSISALWRQLARKVGLTRSSTPDKIAEAICSLWKSQTVIFIFDDLEILPEDCLKDFICDFWEPLAAIANNYQNKNSNYRLLVFLVAGSCLDNLRINSTDKIDNFTPQILLKLPKIQTLSYKELAYWLEMSIKQLPSKLTMEINEVVIDILNNSEEGKPQVALEYICELCNCDWDERQNLWLKH